MDDMIFMSNELAFRTAYTTTSTAPGGVNMGIGNLRFNLSSTQPYVSVAPRNPPGLLHRSLPTDRITSSALDLVAKLDRYSQNPPPEVSRYEQDAKDCVQHPPRLACWRIRRHGSRLPGHCTYILGLVATGSVGQHEPA